MVYSEANIFNETEMSESIKPLMKGRNTQSLIDGVVKYGDAIVPLLIEKYKVLEDEKCYLMITCLCKISSERALKFVRQVIQEHDKRLSVGCAIREYPHEREDDIIQSLIELLNVEYVEYYASERLEKMIIRNSCRAVFLINALDDKKTVEYNGKLGNILGLVSGYRQTETSYTPPGQDQVLFYNKFWRDWWNRNRDKEVFEWLIEAINTENVARKAYALQIMGTLMDQRAAPYFVASLDDKSENVRFWAVVGLRELDGTYPSTGYSWETFKNEEEEIIDFLKHKFKNSR